VLGDALQAVAHGYAMLLLDGSYGDAPGTVRDVAAQAANAALAIIAGRAALTVGGTGPDGTGPDGTSPDGTSPDETSPDETGPDETGAPNRAGAAGTSSISSTSDASGG
jgi:hypothetical protein